MSLESALIVLAVVAVGIAVNVWLRNIKRKEQYEEDCLAQKQLVERHEEEQRKTVEAAAIEQNRLDAIPQTQVTLSVEPRKRAFLKDMPEVKIQNPTKSFNMSSLVTFVVIDTETTGLSASNDRIVEVSAVRFENFEPIEALTTKINPGRSIPADAAAINHLSDDDFTDAPTIEQVAPAIIDFVGSSPLVGWNIMFDLKFLWCSGAHELLERKLKIFDAMAVAKKAWGSQHLSYRLESIAKERNVPHIPHTSLSDCVATGAIFKDALWWLTN